MGRDCDVLIVGGGLNGPVLALALAQAGLTSIVLDAESAAARAAPAFDGRAYALSLSSQRLLAALGLWRGPRRRTPSRSRRSASATAGRARAPRGCSCTSTGRRSTRVRWARSSRTASCAGRSSRRSTPRRRSSIAPARRSSGRRSGRARRSVTLADGVGAVGVAPRRLRRAGERGGGAGRDRAARLGLRPDLAGLRGRARAAAPRRRAPVLHAGGAARHPAAARRPLVDRLDRAERPGGGDRAARRGRLPRRAPAAVRRLPRRDRARGRALRLSARPVARRALDAAAAGAGRRRGARHPPAGRAGAEPRAARRGGAGRGARRRAAARRGHRRRRRARALRPLAALRHRHAGGGDRRAQPAVLERQPAAPPRPRPRARAGQPPAGGARGC